MSYSVLEQSYVKESHPDQRQPLHEGLYTSAKFEILTYKFFKTLFFVIKIPALQFKRIYLK